MLSDLQVAGIYRSHASVLEGVTRGECDVEEILSRWDRNSGWYLRREDEKHRPGNYTFRQVGNVYGNHVILVEHVIRVGKSFTGLVEAWSTMADQLAGEARPRSERHAEREAVEAVEPVTEERTSLGLLEDRLVQYWPR